MPIDNVPLSQPLYGASFPEAITRFFKKYAVFSGRASRSEFWYAYLFIVLVNAAIALIFSSVGDNQQVYATILGLWSLAILVPYLAIGSRRLHDANLSAWFLLLWLAPFVGWIVLMVLWALPSKPEGIRFDEYPSYEAPVVVETVQPPVVEEAEVFPPAPYQGGQPN
mgnify:CR=1 FL=1